jgi:hypothetical protein
MARCHLTTGALIHVYVMREFILVTEDFFVYVRLKVQLDVHVFICILYSSLFLALHVSGAIFTHPQQHKLQRTA